MFDKIHHINGQYSLTADDFSNEFVLRTLVSELNVEEYAALRATGHGKAASFAAAFGGVLYGSPEALEAAAAAFESTGYFETALEEVTELIGEDVIKSELRKRTTEVGGPASDSLMRVRMQFHERRAKQHLSIFSGSMRRVVAQFNEFMESRRKDNEALARRSARFTEDRGVI